MFVGDASFATLTALITQHNITLRIALTAREWQTIVMVIAQFCEDCIGK
jgi:hypothetical protein